MAALQVASKYRVSQKLTDTGIWYVPELCRNDKVKPHFKLARKSMRTNRKYQARMTRYALENKRSVNSTSESSITRVERAALQVFCGTVLLDWKDVFDDQGNVIPYSTEQAFALLIECPDLYDELDEAACERENFIGEGGDKIAAK